MLHDGCWLLFGLGSSAALRHGHQSETLADELAVVFGVEGIKRGLIMEHPEPILGSWTHDRNGPDTVAFVHFHVNRLVVPGVEPGGRVKI